MEQFTHPGKGDAQPPRFIEGRTEEIQELFGVPIPTLPEYPDPAGNHPVFLVQLHPRLQPAFLAFLAPACRSLMAAGRQPQDFQEAERSYFQLLLQITTNIIENERRSGLLNLFWLAHFKEIAVTVREYCEREKIPAHVKYQMHPLVRGFYRLLHRSTWSHFSTTAPQTLEYNLGLHFNHRLIESLFEDQLPFTEVDLAQVNPEGILVEQNRRFRLSGAEYREMRNVLRDRIRLGLGKQERPLIDLIKTHLPGFDPSAYQEEAVQLRMLFRPAIVSYLFTDYDETLGRLTASALLKAGRDRRGGWQHLLHDYMDFIQAVRRCEIIDRFRRRIALVLPGLDEIQLRQHPTEGRLFQFFESTEVLNSARKVTILFADLRGFTAASEGGISEVELTRSLYAVFDPMAGIVKRFKGQIDKFTGDGVMITFGAAQGSPDDEMNAMRTAVAIQALARDLQKQGKMPYQMGIGLHTGRAQIGHFLPDEKSVDVTVIGRHVNIASRVAGSGGRPEEKPGERRGGGASADQAVWIDRQGILYNFGIAATREHVEALRRGSALQIEEGQKGTRYAWFDPELEKKILIEYVGDAKLKGVERAQPIYRVVDS